MLIKRRFYSVRDTATGGDGGVSTGGGATPAAPAAAPATPAPAGAPQAPEKTSFSLEYVQELRAENAKYRTSAKEAKEAAEAAEKRVKDAEKAAEAKARDAEDKATARIIRAELKAAAIKAGMVDLDGLKLADLSGVKLDDSGDVVGADDLMKALKESKPYLFGQPQSTTQTQQTPPKKEEPKPFDARTATDEERAARAREMGITLKKR